VGARVAAGGDVEGFLGLEDAGAFEGAAEMHTLRTGAFPVVSFACVRSPPRARIVCPSVLAPLHGERDRTS